MPFRVVGIVALGVVLGFLLGGIAPRIQLAEQGRELSALKKRLERFDRPNLLRELFPAFGGGGAPIAQSSSREAEPQSVARSDATPNPVGDDARARASNGDALSAERAAGSNESRARVVPSMQPKGRSAEAVTDEDRQADQGADDASEEGRSRRDQLDMRDFDKLIAVQRLRAAQSRAALIEQAGLNPQEVALLDRNVAKMNEELAGYGEELVQQVTADEPPSPSQMLGLGHDVSGIMLEAQQGIDKVLGERGDTVDREAKEIWNYIDVGPMRDAAEQLLPKDKPAASADDEEDGL